MSKLPDYLKKKAKKAVKGVTVGTDVGLYTDDYVNEPSGSFTISKGKTSVKGSVSKPYLKDSKQNLNSTLGLTITKHGKKSAFSVEGSKTGKSKKIGFSFSKSFTKGGLSSREATKYYKGII
jgi:hypothetical protein|tara:strand:+ start:177 stop:542 length:366 start_codon:yes stop_codon:yes gene_type:complete